jgi:hypothetical protein
LEQLIDLDWVAESDAMQQALWEGRPFARLPCIVSTPTPTDWPSYPFTERWDDVEKPFIHLLWSGSRDRIREACASTDNTRSILALPENRYGAKSLDDARERLARVRSFQAIPKAAW